MANWIDDELPRARDRAEQKRKEQQQGIDWLRKMNADFKRSNFFRDGRVICLITPDGSSLSVSRDQRVINWRAEGAVVFRLTTGTQKTEGNPIETEELMKQDFGDALRLVIDGDE